MPSFAPQLPTGDQLLDSMRLVLAAGYAPRKWRQGLNWLAGQIDRGVALDVAITQGKAQLPSTLVRLLVSALPTRSPCQFILDAIQLRNQSRYSWRFLWYTLAYPLAILVLTVGIVAIVTILVTQAVDVDSLENFGLAGTAEARRLIQDQADAILALTYVTAWTILVPLTIAVAGPPDALMSILGGLIVFGRPARWIAMSELLARFELFLSQGLNPIEAAGQLEKSFSGVQCRAAAFLKQQLQQGLSMGEALADLPDTDRYCRPCLLALDDAGVDTPAMLKNLATLFSQMAEERCQALRGVFPPVIILLGVSILWGMINGYLAAFAPIFQMITSLI